MSELARSKLIRVLGEAQGARAYEQALAAAELRAITTPDELHRFAEVLSKSGGMVAAVGGILSVAAVLRGANAR